jgi:hypothetical protein
MMVPKMIKRIPIQMYGASEKLFSPNTFSPKRSVSIDSPKEREPMLPLNPQNPRKNGLG